MKPPIKTPDAARAPSLDWPELRRRVEAAQAVLERGVTPSAEARKQILRERAKALALEPRPAESRQETLEIVEFLLAHERYGIESSYVREVYPLTDYTALPGTPRFVLGIISVRGRILSVVDLRHFFELPQKGISELNKVLILHNETMEFGVLADAVFGARSLRLSELQPPLSTLTGIGHEFLRGVTSERLVVLDGGKILNDPRMIVREESKQTETRSV